MSETVINLNLSLEPVIPVNLGIDDQITLDIVPEPELHIIPKGRELKVVNAAEMEDTDYLTIYNIAKL